jgi:SAM-dependent methyltransferase
MPHQSNILRSEGDELIMHDCYLCGSNEIKRLRPVYDMLFPLPGIFQLVECRSCGLVYLDDRPQPEEISQYYPSEYLPYRPAIQDERSALMRWVRRRNIMRRVNLLRKHSQPGAVLDIGCSTGIFLDAMIASGWTGQGIEIMPEVAAYARSRFGLNVVTGEFETVPLESRSFNAITLWDVLEHTFDPLAVLKKAHRVLKDDGIIAITIPHWESLDHRLFGQHWIGFDVPRHLFMFRQPVLEKLLREAGFSVIQASCGLGGYYTFLASYKLWSNKKISSSAWRDGIERALRFPGVRIPFQPFFSLIDWLGAGGTLVVVAKKM